MKTTSYSDCFSQVRVMLRETLALDYDKASFFVSHGVLGFELLSHYADDLTAFNEVSGLPFFSKFKDFENYDA